MSGIWDPNRSELDTNPPRGSVPEVSYLVCATPRSGSGLLCRALGDAGAGVPAEYFNPNQRVPLTQRWGCGPTASAYAAALVSRRTGANGVFGTKLHWTQLDELAREEHVEPDDHPAVADLVGRLFPRAVYVHIERHALDEQAVSLWVALHTGIWSKRTSVSGTKSVSVPYDYTGIYRCRAEIVDGESQWQRFFRRSGITPVEVVYERLVDTYAEVVRSMLEALVPGRLPAEIFPPDSCRLADERSAEFVERFKRDRRLRGQPRAFTLPLLALAARRRAGIARATVVRAVGSVRPR